MKRLGLESLESRCVLATLIAGQVVDDLNGNGVIEDDEPGQSGVQVYVDANGNDMLDVVGGIVEPDDFADGETIDASAQGITLSVVDDANEPIPGSPAITARFDEYASTGSHVFARDVAFFEFFHRLRIDFATPVSSVQINFTGTRPVAGQAGRMEAYAADGSLIDSYETGQLLNSQYETMTIVRGTADIAYVSAFTGKTEQLSGRLDSLRFNSVDSELWTLTNNNGDYQLAVPEGGTYRVNEIVPDGFEQTLPEGDGGQDVAITTGQTVAGIDFANHAAATGSWQNPLEPLDVDGDGGIFPIDALLIINELNIPQYRDPVTGQLPPPPANIPAYFDVDGDGFASPTDAILVINFLNTPQNVQVATGAEGEPAAGDPTTIAAALDATPLDPVHATPIESADESAGVREGDGSPARPLELQSVESVFSGDEWGALVGAALADDSQRTADDGPTV